MTGDINSLKVNVNYTYLTNIHGTIGALTVTGDVASL